VLQLSRKNATIIKMPPIIAANESGMPVRNQSTRATRKIVRRAATDESTGEVKEMSTRKEPENARRSVSYLLLSREMGIVVNLLALAAMEMRSIHPASPVGNRKVSQPR
jgi:hypothetical protein